MGFRFQRRINLGGGWGLNTGRTGGSLSFRSQQGSIGTKGFSMRTGIPGLSYRQSWGKNAGGAALIVLALMAALVIAGILVKLLVYALPFLWACLKWIVMTLYDLCRYGISQIPGLRSRTVAPYSMGRDALLGGTICGAVCLVFGLYFSNTPLPDSQSTVAVAAAPQRVSQTAVARAGVAETVRRLATTTRPSEFDDLARVRNTDAVAADRIEGFCARTAATGAIEKGEMIARCRRKEVAAWMRLYLYHEFPSIDPGVVEKCTSTLVQTGFEMEEDCIRVELSAKRGA